MDPLVQQITKRPSLLHILSLSEKQEDANTQYRHMFQSDFGKNEYGTSFKSSRDEKPRIDETPDENSVNRHFEYSYESMNQIPKHSVSPKPSKAKDDVKEFASKTTAHGWGRVLQERLVLLKLVWVFLTIAAYICNGLHITLLVDQFLGYPSEHVTRIELQSIEFPSVTICNIQPISFTTGLMYFSNTSSNLYYWDNLTHSYFNSPAVENMTDEDREYLYNRVTQPLGYFENIGDEYQEIGHQPQDFFLRCMFSYKDCIADNFTYFPNPTYFNCYTFNGGNTSKEKLSTRATGPQYGLSLILYLESDNGDMLHNGTYHTLSNVGNAAGVRVVVHSPDTMPSPMDKGFDIPPGFSSSIGLRVTENTRLGEPYGQCISDKNLSDTLYTYSSAACIAHCQQQFVMDKCHCISASLPVPSTPSDLSYCGRFNPQYPQHFFDNLSCEASQLEEFVQTDNMSTICGCYSPCHEITYTGEISYSYWPLDFAQESFYDYYVLRHPNKEQLKPYTNLQKFNLTELINNNLIRKNFIRLNVFLKDLVIEKVEQKKTYELQNLMSDVGGTFGLWIGVSLLSWFEIVELMVTVIFKGAVWGKKKAIGMCNLGENVISVQPSTENKKA